MKRIVIQPGHVNIAFNCVSTLRAGTGAPGEAAFTLRTANRLSEILRSKGFEVKQTDANANCDAAVTGADWDLFLAVHYDADVYGTGGGLVAAPDPSVDSASAESVRIRNVIRTQYFKHAGIAEHEERQNPNTSYYYMWSALSAKTPCVLIECGVGQDAHDRVILADQNIVAESIARGVCQAFGVPFDAPVPTPTPPPPAPPPAPAVDYKKALVDIKAILTKAGI